MAACPGIVNAIVTSYKDLLGNTTRTSHGTSVSLRCEGGYLLDGSNVLRCSNGLWDRPVPRCVDSVAANNSLSKVDLIVLIVCVVIATIVLFALTILTILYRRKMANLKQRRSRNKLVFKNYSKSSVSYGSPLEGVFSEFSDEEDDMDYLDRNFLEYRLPRDSRIQGNSLRSRDIPLREYHAREIREQSSSSKQQRKERHLKRVHSLDRTFREHRNVQSLSSLDRAASDAQQSQRLSSTPLDTSSSALHFGAALRWDPHRMYWHDSFDYTRSKIPRPQVGKTYVPNYFLQSGQYYTFG